MTCKEFDQTMKDFFDNSIDNEFVLEAFAGHYHTCRECREEMEIQYILQLKPEDWLTDKIYDFSGTLANIVKEREDELEFCKQIKRINYRMILFTAIAVLVVLGYQLAFWMR